jgi:hypothetical protein
VAVKARCVAWCLGGVLVGLTDGAAQDRTADVARIQVIGLRKALQMAATVWKGSVVYVSVGDDRADPSQRLLEELADGVHTFKPASSCPRDDRFRGIAREFCRAEPGAVEVFIVGVSFLSDGLAEANVGHGFSATSGMSCWHRFKRTSDGWSLVSQEEFVGVCRVS